VKKGNDIVANLLVSLALDYFLPVKPESSPEKPRKTIEEASLEKVAVKKLSPNNKPPPLQPELSFTPSKQKITTPTEPLVVVNEISENVKPKNPIDTLLLNANQLENEFKKYLTNENVPFYDNQFNFYNENVDNRKSEEIPFFLRDDDK